jgi:uncharacterized glyoxalase superfamily protein PhnB
MATSLGCFRTPEHATLSTFPALNTGNVDRDEKLRSRATSATLVSGTISEVTSGSAAAERLRDLARLRRVRDRIDREYAQPLNVEALARDAHMSAGHPDASLGFYRDTLGFEVRNDVGYGGMRWITVGPPDQPDTSIVLYPPGATPGITDDERRTIAEMMAKGTFATILLATKDLDVTFERVQANADIVQEPTDQPYGVRDCAIRDPAGNLIRIQELP